MAKTIWDYLGLGAPDENNPWSNLGQASDTGLSETGYELGLSTSTPPASSQRTVDLAQQQSIIQKRELPFLVQDVHPFQYWDQKAQTTRLPLLCSLTKIFDKVGIDFEIGTQLSQILGATSTAPWVTIPIQTPGNFIKFEFLPSKVNYMMSDPDALVPGSYSTAGFVRANVDESYNPSIVNNTGLTPADPSADNPSNSYWSFWGAHTQIFVQFDTTDSPLILVKDGDIFNLPFNVIFVTFAIQTPPFSIIVGNGSTIINSRDHKVMASNPAFGPGDSLWTNPKRHCTAFCISEQDQGFGGSNTIGSGATITKTLFSQVVTGSPSPNMAGVAIGWISNFLISGAQVGNTTAGLFLEYKIYVLRTDGSKKLITRALILQAGGGASASTSASVNLERQFSIPKRFVLKSGEKLMLDVQNTSGQVAQYTFTIDGYVYGRVNSQSVEGTAFPGYQLDTVTSNPFPLDNNRKPS